MDPFHTIGQVVEYIEHNYSNPQAFNSYESGHWRSLSTESFIFNLKRLTYGLISMGLRKGETVGILAQSSPVWTLADLAIVMAGGITVPLFERISGENLIYESAQANIRFVFVQGQEQWILYDNHRSLFEQVIALDDPGEISGAIELQDVFKRGETLWQQKPLLWEELTHQQKSDDIMTIIYTAGATGMPKGVMLSHENLCHLISPEVIKWDVNKDKYLSILPLAHVFSRQIQLVLMGWGVSVYYLNDLSSFAAVCKDLKPTGMIVVPRVLEKWYQGIESKVAAEKNPTIKRIAQWAIKLARDPVPSLLKTFVLRPLAEVLFYSSVRKAFGDNWRMILCGGAALDPILHHFFLNVGIPIYEGWGLTEGSTAVVNVPGASKVGCVGKPLPGVKVKLGEQDELLISGPTVMKGYYRNPDATQAAIDEEGWLHTGDKGAFDADGFVKLIGRVKEQFKMSSGEYIVPGRIEYMLTQNPLIDMALVIGEKRKFASCLLFPDMNIVKKWKKEQNAEHISDEEFLKSEFVTKEVEALLKKVNKRVNAWEKLYKFRFIFEIPSVENGEVTPTQKLKRDVILKKYQTLIENIYEEGRE